MQRGGFNSLVGGQMVKEFRDSAVTGLVTGLKGKKRVFVLGN